MLSKRYTIIVEGGLGQRFAGAFPTASLVAEDGKTRLDTEPLDQSQLHGLLERLRSFAIELVSVHEVVEPQRSPGSVADGLPRQIRAPPPSGATDAQSLPEEQGDEHESHYSRAAAGPR